MNNSKPLQNFFKSVGKTKLLTREEEVELSKRIEAGDQAARDRMIRANIRLAISIAKKYANKRAKLKKIINNKKIELAERFAAQLKLNKLPKNSSKIRVRNRCEITGRPHGVYRKLKISRIALREMASDGKIPGIIKSSW